MIARYVRVKKSRSARRGPWRSEAKRRWIASLPCDICESPDTQAAHVPSDDIAEHGGASMKGTDALLISLCIHGHHAQFDGAAKCPDGQVGRAAFERYYAYDAGARAAQLHEIWVRRSL